MLYEIRRRLQNMSQEELWAYHQVIVEKIQDIRELNPPRLSGGKRGELTDKMNQLLIDLFAIKKCVEDKLQKT